MIRILVTGRSGQLAQSLLGLRSTTVAIFAVGRPELDIAERGSIARVFADIRPDIVVNAAAFTAVDGAEAEADLAYAVNHHGAQHVAELAYEWGLPIIQISTDYVFDGRKALPYEEADAVHPLGVYGASKLAGEHAVASANVEHVILRTGWIHSAYGHNFIKTMLRLGGERKSIRVVWDQFGTPTYAPHLAHAVVRVAEQALSGRWEINRPRIYHVSSQGSVNWADFARYIFELSRDHGGPWAHIEPICSSEYLSKAVRPAYSVLDSTKFQQVFEHRLPHWKQGVELCVKELLRAGSNASVRLG